MQDLERKLSALRQQERELDSRQRSQPQQKQHRSQVHHKALPLQAILIHAVPCTVHVYVGVWREIKHGRLSALCKHLTMKWQQSLVYIYLLARFVNVNQVGWASQAYPCCIQWFRGNRDIAARVYCEC